MWSVVQMSVKRVFTGPQAFSFIPAFVLAGYWLGGEPALLTITLAMPVMALLLRTEKKNTAKLKGITFNAKTVQKPKFEPFHPINTAETKIEKRVCETWWQPQISNHTGEISGFAACDRGTRSPSNSRSIGNTETFAALNETMLDAEQAIVAWKKTGFVAPCVEISLSAHGALETLIADKILWEIDRLSLEPEQLSFVISEAKSFREDGALELKRLSDHGCSIGLKVSGTKTHLPSLIRRTGANHLNLSRRLFAGIDKTPEHTQRINNVILMAQDHGLETTAVGVATSGEHACLAQLGCDNVQGAGLAPPLPLRDTHDWITAHAIRLQSHLCISRNSS